MINTKQSPKNEIIFRLKALFFFHTFSSSCRELPSSRNGFTISSVTAKFGGSSEQRLITLGLGPFRNWDP